MSTELKKNIPSRVPVGRTLKSTPMPVSHAPAISIPTEKNQQRPTRHKIFAARSEEAHRTGSGERRGRRRRRIESARGSHRGVAATMELASSRCIATARRRGGARVLRPLRPATRRHRGREAGEGVWGFGKCRGARAAGRSNGRGGFSGRALPYAVRTLPVGSDCWGRGVTGSWCPSMAGLVPFPAL